MEDGLVPFGQMAYNGIAYVLILVVMEDGLVLSTRVLTSYCHLVLILVVMEDGLVLVFFLALSRSKLS